MATISERILVELKAYGGPLEAWEIASRLWMYSRAERQKLGSALAELAQLGAIREVSGLYVGPGRWEIVPGGEA